MQKAGPFGRTTPQAKAGLSNSLSARKLTLIGLMLRSNFGLGQQLTQTLAAIPAARLVYAPTVTADLMPHVGLVRHEDSERLLRRLGAFTPAVLDPGAIPTAEKGLYGHIAAQLPLIFRQPSERVIAERYAEAIEPWGWLGTTVAAVAARCACPAEDAQRILLKLQSEIVPSGLFARGLSECLRLQAGDAGLLDAGMAIILDNLPLLAEGKLDLLATRSGMSRPELDVRLGQIRRFDPKPGSRFDQSSTRFCFGPDLVLRHERTGWTLELCGETLPRLTLSEHADDPAGVREVRWWIDAIESRNQKLLTVARLITRHQLAYLSGAAPAPVPLAVGQIAARTGLHISSVGRIAGATTVHSPRGLLSLRALMPGSSGARSDLSTTALRQRLRDLIADEVKPLSDAAIVAVLAADGIHLSRRAIAQHRAALGIGSSRDRSQSG
ncbi:hypothetical protein [Pseudotabrizicola sp. 4114]|uniref:RNA polymerase factor sigma-54 n=1 Tax=Pseudotabrizicola sp. 4114 TaxID=2817731 RepID=UPI00285C99C2|nr:RNA polymerase sigma-54 factor [Pseudorhodobacter sp. 4114]